MAGMAVKYWIRLMIIVERAMVTDRVRVLSFLRDNLRSIVMIASQRYWGFIQDRQLIKFVENLLHADQ